MQEAARQALESHGDADRPAPSASDALAAARVPAHPSSPDTPPAATVRVAAPAAPAVNHLALAQHIAARARNLPQAGAMELRFALEPADLGPVRVRIESRGSRLRIEIAAASSAAVEALTPGLSRLSSELQRAGFRDAEVSLGLEARDGGAPDARQHGGNAEGRPSDPAPSYRALRHYERERPGTHDGRRTAARRFDRTV